MKRTLWLNLLGVLALLLTSCSSPVYAPIDETSQGATYEKGVPGGTVVETYKLRATVTDIDTADRKITLAERDGKKAVVKCGPEVVNFDQIRVGDIVKARVTEGLTVAMANAATPPGNNSASLVALAPKGAKPGGIWAETQQYTATISKINLKKRQATLQFPDGTTRTFTVRKDVDLTQRSVGEEVAFRVTVSTAVSVEKAK